MLGVASVRSMGLVGQCTEGQGWGLDCAHVDGEGEGSQGLGPHAACLRPTGAGGCCALLATRMHLNPWPPPSWQKGFCPLWREHSIYNT